MVNIQDLFDDAKCFQTARDLRWPDGLTSITRITALLSRADWADVTEELANRGTRPSIAILASAIGDVPSKAVTTGSLEHGATGPSPVRRRGSDVQGCILRRLRPGDPLLDSGVQPAMTWTTWRHAE